MRVGSFGARGSQPGRAETLIWLLQAGNAASGCYAFAVMQAYHSKGRLRFVFGFGSGAHLPKAC